MTEPGERRFAAYGDSAVLVTIGDRIDPAINRRVHAAAAAVEALSRQDGRFGRPVPAYASLLVPVEPLALGTDAAIDRLRDLLETAPAVDDAEAGAAPVIELPTAYGGPDGVDLPEVAERHGLRERDVAELHASIAYTVYFLGFAPGFAYLGPVPAAIATPRRETPRTRVPAGSVGIAGTQTGVYPFAMPGGWQLIGRTEARLWDPGRPDPALLAPGARVRFVPLAAR
jgi:inhibitor of KinA